MAICWTVICLWIATKVINTSRAHGKRFIINDNTNELCPPTSSVSLPSSTIPQIPNIPPLPDGSHTHNNNKTNADSLQTTTPNNNDGNHDNSKYVDAKLFNRNISAIEFCDYESMGDDNDNDNDVFRICKSISFSDLKGFDSSLSQTEMINTITYALEYSNVILLFYSITSENSFIGNYSVQNIKTEIDKALIKLNQKKIILLIGTKLDLENERVITYQQGEELANIWEIPFFEISNKNGTNIKRVIDIICEIYKYDNIIDKQETDNNINGANGALDVP